MHSTSTIPCRRTDWTNNIIGTSPWSQWRHTESSDLARCMYYLLYYSVDCGVPSIIPYKFRILLWIIGKHQVCAFYRCTLQLERMLKSFNFLNITLNLKNGVISANDKVLSISTLRQSNASISAMNNYAKTWNLSY